jgi:hypothetical protein
MAKNKTTVEQVTTDLQMDEQIQMQENGWKFQAIGLLFIIALVLAAALGLFGDGILSQKKQASNDIQIEYERFYRFEARMPVKIKVEDTGVRLMVSFPNSYLQNFEIESILPEPNNNTFEGDRVQYEFDGKDRMNVTFYLIPRKVGNFQSSIEVNQSHFQINHFIFP